MNKNKLAAGAGIAVLTLALSACSAGGSSTGAAATNCTNKIVHKDATAISVWAWYPNMQTVVDNFNNTHSDVQVCWTNAGGGTDEYSKVQTAISAKTGLPDVIMVEADHLPTYEIQDALVDISKYGANDVKDNFSEGAWKDVSQGSAVYAIPIDGGPMGLIYRSDIFKKYGITTPPTTWQQYAADAKKIKDAGGPFMATLGATSPAQMMAMQMQNGAVPFQYSLQQKNDITIKLNDEGSKEVLNFWAGLVKDGLVDTTNEFTTQYVQGLTNGKYATYPSAAWTPGYMSGAGVGKGAKTAWAVAPMPKWSPSDPAINWGGSTLAVTTQSKEPKLATKVVTELYADEKSLTDGWKNQVIFPLNKKALDSPAFVANKSDFFNGQTANKDIYIPEANAYTGIVYAPFQTYYYGQFQQVLTQINQGKMTGDEAADSLQAAMVKYAQGQGFKVTE